MIDYSYEIQKRAEQQNKNTDTGRNLSTIGKTNNYVIMGGCTNAPDGKIARENAEKRHERKKKLKKSWKRNGQRKKQRNKRQLSEEWQIMQRKLKMSIL